MRSRLSWTLPWVLVCLLGLPSDRIASAQDELQTPEERARYDKIVEDFIQYDVGKLRGEAGQAANARFRSLQNPKAIPSLVRGAIQASRIPASCPIVVISNKLGGMLRSTRDPRLLQHALDYLKTAGPPTRYGTYLNNLRQIANEQYRQATGKEPATPTELRGGGTASQLRRSRLQLDDWSSDDLTEAASELQGTELLQVLAELKDRKGSVYTEALAAAIRTVDDDVKPIARGLLATRLTRMTDRTLKAKMKSSDAEVRAAAALAIGYKGSPLYRELAAAMRDGNLLVAQNSRDVLVKMLGEDLGPEDGASGIEWYQASKRWEQWIEDWEKFVELQNRPASGGEPPSEGQTEGQKSSSDRPAEGQKPSSP